VIVSIPNNIITIIQTLGGILFLYLVFGIINGVMAFRRNSKIERGVESIHEMSRDIKELKRILLKKSK